MLNPGTRTEYMEGKLGVQVLVPCGAIVDCWKHFMSDIWYCRFFALAVLHSSLSLFALIRMHCKQIIDATVTSSASLHK